MVGVAISSGSGERTPLQVNGRMRRIARLFLVLALLSGSAHSRRDPESGQCSEDGCPADELEKVGDGSAQKWSIFSAISDTIISVKDTLKYHAYKKFEGIVNTTAEFVYNKVEDFSERVRSVFREEFSSFLDIMWESAVGTDPANGRTVLYSIQIFKEEVFLLVQILCF